MIPRTGFSRKFAAISIPFGSVNDSVRTDGGRIRLPAGTAHYMEHCIFSKDENGGLLSRLSSMGANANAYTSFDHTMYYFTSSENFSEILDVYAKAVMEPYLGQDRIDAERDIIIQELKMYKDNPDSRAFNELTSNLYIRHPVRTDIAGSPDSVRRIRPGHLNAIKDTRYSPSSAILTICGEVGESDIPDLSGFSPLKAGDLTAGTLRNEGVSEPYEVRSHGSVLKMDVAVQSFLVGYKNRDIRSVMALPEKRYLLYKKRMDILLDTLFGETSEAYEWLLNQGLINDSFGFSSVNVRDASFTVFGGESHEPERAANEFRRLLKEAVAKGPDSRLRNDFCLKLRMGAGDFMRSLDHIDSMGMHQARLALHGLDIFEYFDIYDNIDIDEAFADLKAAFDDDSSTAVFVLRKG